MNAVVVNSYNVDVVSSFKFTLDKFIGKKPIIELKQKTIIECLNALSYYFEDLSEEDVREINKACKICGKNLFKHVTYEESLETIKSHLDKLYAEEYREMFEDIVMRNHELCYKTHLSLDFVEICGLLYDITKNVGPIRRRHDLQ